jgi:quercetin dioxygenase-like cupin family protein
MNKVLGKKVNKPWGHELWIADGVRTPYALKRILFESGKRSSLHVHRFKYETNFVIGGSGFIQLSDGPIDFDLYLNSKDAQSYIADFVSGLIEIPLLPGDIVDVEPGYLHRVVSTSDLIFVECSTCHLDDVFRIEDDSNRGHGRIDSEHSY